MYFMKIIGLILIAATGFLAGCFKSAGLKIRLAELNGFERLIGGICQDIRYDNSDLITVLVGHSEHEFVAYITEKLRDMPFDDAYKQSVEEYFALKALMRDEKEILLSFGDRLGKSDREGQIMNCKSALAKLEFVIKSARDEKEKKSKFYITLGSLCGAAAALMLM